MKGMAVKQTRSGKRYIIKTDPYCIGQRQVSEYEVDYDHAVIAMEAKQKGYAEPCEITLAQLVNSYEFDLGGMF